MKKSVLFILGLIIILIVAGTVLWVNVWHKDKNNNQGFFANLPIVSDLKSTEIKGEQFQSEHGYQCTIPKDFNLSSLEENQKISLTESKAVAISKNPHKGAYPLNYRANIAIYIYYPDDDLFTSGEFDLVSVNDFLIQKDNLLEGDEEIVKPLEQEYQDIELDGQKGKEHFFSAATNQGNVFAENNLLFKVNNIIYAVSFHDLGNEAEVNRNLETFKQFYQQFKFTK